MNTITRVKYLCITLSLLMLAACGSSGDETAQTKTDETSQATADKPSNEPPGADRTVDPVAEAENLPAEKPAEEPPKPKPEAKPVKKKPSPPPKPTTVAIPAGTSFAVALNGLLRTDSNQVGDRFSAATIDDVSVDGKTVIPAGTTVRGHLTDVEEPHRTSGRARMTLQFDEFVGADGQSYALTVLPIALEADPEQLSDEEKVAVGGVVGGVIGALTSKKKGKGAAVGAAIGAAAGGAVAVATKGKQLELVAGQELNVEITETATVPATAVGNAP